MIRESYPRRGPLPLIGQQPGPPFHFIFLSFLKLILFIYFWLCWVFDATWTFSSCGAGASHCSGSSCCGTHGASVVAALGSRAQTHELWPTGLAAPWHVGSSWTRDGWKLCLLRWQGHQDSRPLPSFSFLKLSTRVWVRGALSSFEM